MAAIGALLLVIIALESNGWTTEGAVHAVRIGPVEVYTTDVDRSADDDCDAWVRVTGKPPLIVRAPCRRLDGGEPEARRGLLRLRAGETRPESAREWFQPLERRAL